MRFLGSRLQLQAGVCFPQCRRHSLARLSAEGKQRGARKTAVVAGKVQCRFDARHSKRQGYLLSQRNKSLLQFACRLRPPLAESLIDTYTILIPVNWGME